MTELFYYEFIQNGYEHSKTTIMRGPKVENFLTYCRSFFNAAISNLLAREGRSRKEQKILEEDDDAECYMNTIRLDDITDEIIDILVYEQGFTVVNFDRASFFTDGRMVRKSEYDSIKKSDQVRSPGCHPVDDRLLDVIDDYNKKATAHNDRLWSRSLSDIGDETW